MRCKLPARMPRPNMMRNSLAIALSGLLLFWSGGCASYSRARTAKRVQENAALTTAQEWVELLDASEYQKAFERRAQPAHANITAEEFARRMRSYRTAFGRVISRKFIGAHSSRKLVGLPDGEYETVLFKTRFEHKSTGAERVILTKAGGRRQVIGYRVY